MEDIDTYNIAVTIGLSAGGERTTQVFVEGDCPENAQELALIKLWIAINQHKSIMTHDDNGMITGFVKTEDIAYTSHEDWHYVEFEEDDEEVDPCAIPIGVSGQGTELLAGREPVKSQEWREQKER